MQPFQPLNIKVEPKPITETQPQHTITSVAAAAAAAVSAAVAAEQAAAAEKAALAAAAAAGGGGVGGERVPYFSQASVSDVEPKRGLKRSAESPLSLDVNPEFTALRDDVLLERIQYDDQNMFKVRMKVSEFYFFTKLWEFINPFHYFFQSLIQNSSFFFVFSTKYIGLCIFTFL